MTSKAATLTIQKWGNSLAVRIPSPIARNAHVHAGTVVKITVERNKMIVQPTGKIRLTLDDRLALFDPEKHGGELMADQQIGLEKF